MFNTTQIARSVAAVALAFLTSAMFVDSASAGHHHGGAACCEPVCCEPVCCPCPPPIPDVSKTICLYDACTCTTSQATLCIPATCCDEVPQITWRSGIFGRRIATLCWPGCGYKAEVVVTRHGRVIVRD